MTLQLHRNVFSTIYSTPTKVKFEGDLLSLQETEENILVDYWLED